MNAQERLMANAPAPVSDNAKGAGGNGDRNFSQAIHNVARPGMSTAGRPAALSFLSRISALRPKTSRRQSTGVNIWADRRGSSC